MESNMTVDQLYQAMLAHGWTRAQLADKLFNNELPDNMVWAAVEVLRV